MGYTPASSAISPCVKFHLSAFLKLLPTVSMPTSLSKNTNWSIKCETKNPFQSAFPNLHQGLLCGITHTWIHVCLLACQTQGSELGTLLWKAALPGKPRNYIWSHSQQVPQRAYSRKILPLFTFPVYISQALRQLLLGATICLVFKWDKTCYIWHHFSLGFSCSVFSFSALVGVYKVCGKAIEM